MEEKQKGQCRASHPADKARNIGLKHTFYRPQGIEVIHIGAIGFNEFSNLRNICFLEYLANTRVKAKISNTKNFALQILNQFFKRGRLIASEVSLSFRVLQPYANALNVRLRSGSEFFERYFDSLGYNKKAKGKIVADLTQRFDDRLKVFCHVFPPF